MADYNLKAITADTDGPSADTELLFGSPDQSSGTPKPYSFGGIRNYIRAQNGILPISDPDFNDANIYLTTPYVTSNTAAGIMVANRLVMIPIWVPRTRLYTTYAMVTTILSASTSIRVALYNCNDLLQATTRLDVGSATIDTSTGTGVIGRKTVPFTVNQTLTPGLYFLACMSDGGPTVIRAANGANCSMGLVFATSGINQNMGKYRDGLTYASGMPADETSQAASYVTMATGTQAMPIVGIR